MMRKNPKNYKVTLCIGFIIAILIGCSAPGEDNSTSASPTIQLDGIIVDTRTRAPLDNVTVSTDYGFNLTSNAAGRFQFRNRGGSKIQINACKPGYRNACLIVDFDEFLSDVNYDVSTAKVVRLELEEECADTDTTDIDDDGLPCEIDWLNDNDKDGVDESLDQCPGVDDRIDRDADSIPDCIDSFIDSDADGIPDGSDICSGMDDTVDDNFDGIADCNVAEADYDQDGLTHQQEQQLKTNTDNADSDNDSLSDFIEVGPELANPLDTDADGVIDALDSDSDNDGVPDLIEAGYDTDSDGIEDYRDNNAAIISLKTIDGITLQNDSLGFESLLTVESVQPEQLCTCNHLNTGLPDDIVFATISTNMRSTEFIVELNPPSNVSQQYKSVKLLDSTQSWFERENSDNNSTLQLSDGGFGDLDGLDNGRIVTIFGPSLEPQSLLPDTGCFIATAAYGSPLAPEIDVLRSFRDRHLLTNQPGRWFVQQYYAHSPPIAEKIAENIVLRYAILSILTPVVYTVKHPIEVLTVLIFSMLGIRSIKNRRHSVKL